MYDPDNVMTNPIKRGGLTTEHATGAIVIGALVFLIAINRGFRGVSVGKLSGGLVRS
jgi:hypothetical protein